MLESAIPVHLRVPRTQNVKTPLNYEPPFPAYSARFPTSIKTITMAVIGAQLPTPSELDRDVLAPLQAFVEKASDSSPSFWEPASVKDNSNFLNIAIIAYWPSKTKYTEWCENSGFENWWQQLDPNVEHHGWFREVFFPPIERFETVFSDNVQPEGAAHMREEMSGAIQEHVYWGSARDRFPAAQTDPLDGEQAARGAKIPQTPDHTEATKKRIHVEGKRNLCVIRSGQDWSNTLPKERELYLNTMHPVLIKGIDFLRDHGEDVGCYSCRFMEVLGPVTSDAGTDRTFGLAYFDSLASLERWSREHKTHLDIFGRFLQYARELENNVSLRLFHEVLVLQPEQQFFEYIGCHMGTGMLVA